MKPFYKIDPEDLTLCTTNLLYTPYVSEGKFCMSFNHLDPYQNEKPRPYYTPDLVKFFFNREVKYFLELADKPYAPQLIELDPIKQKIIFKFPGETCNHIIYSGRKLEDYCPDWKQQLHTIIKDLVSSGYYKTSLYPHCFFIEEGILKTFDFYGCASIDNPYVKFEMIKGMVGESSKHRFAEALNNNNLDISILFKRALETYVKWPNNELANIYKELYA